MFLERIQFIAIEICCVSFGSYVGEMGSRKSQNSYKTQKRAEPCLRPSLLRDEVTLQERLWAGFLTSYGLCKASSTPVRTTIRFSFSEKIQALVVRETRLHAKLL